MSDLPERIWLDQSFQPYRVWTIEMSDLPEYVRTLPAAIPAEDVRAGALKEAAALVATCSWGGYWSLHGGGQDVSPIDLSDAILALIPEAAADDLDWNELPENWEG